MPNTQNLPGVDRSFRELEDQEPEPAHTGNGWQYFPTNIEDLHDAVRRRADFHALSEVSRFASALMDALVREQIVVRMMQGRIDALNERVRALSAQQPTRNETC